MKPRTTLILVGAFALLLVYVYFGELRRPVRTEPGTPTPAPLWGVASDQVVGLTLRDSAQETRLSRPAGGAWRLEAPTAEEADGERVERSLSQLTDLTANRTFTDTVGALADYGLGEPTLTVTLHLADGSARVLKVGGPNPLGTAYYAQVEGQAAVHLVPDYLVQDLRGLLDQPPVRPTPTPTAAATPTVAPTAAP